MGGVGLRLAGGVMSHMQGMTLLYIVCADRQQAETISRDLLAARLIACVNLHPISSIYCWQGQQTADNEVVLLAKTLNDVGLIAAIEGRVRELHSYEVPCIMQLPVQHVNADYLRWIQENVDVDR